MALFAANSLLKSIHKIFENRENDVNADFVLKYNDGSETKVHSLILIQASEVLAKMVTGDFKEKSEKIIQFPENNDATVALFVRFLYGFEMPKKEVDVEVAKELLLMAELYELPGLKDNVGFIMNDLLTKENVFDMWIFSNTHKAGYSKETCGKYIVTNFDRDNLIKTGKLVEIPDLANWVIEDDHCRNIKSVLSIFESNGYVLFSGEPNVCSLQFYREYNMQRHR